MSNYDYLTQDQIDCLMQDQIDCLMQAQIEQLQNKINSLQFEIAQTAIKNQFRQHCYNIIDVPPLEAEYDKHA